MPKRLPFEWNEANKERFDRAAKRIERAMNTNAVRLAPDVHVQPVIRENVKSMADLKSFETIANALEREGGLKVHKNKWGVEYTNTGRAIQRAQVNIINRRRRERAVDLGINMKAIARDDKTKKTRPSFAHLDASRFNPLSEREKEVMPKKLYTQYKTKLSYSKAAEATMRQSMHDYYENRDELYRQNYIKSLYNAGFPEEVISQIKDKVYSLSPLDFYRLVGENDILTIGYNYNSTEIALKSEAILEAWDNIIAEYNELKENYDMLKDII